MNRDISTAATASADLLIMHKSCLPSTRAVLNCVARKWPDVCTMSELLAVFVQHDFANPAMKRTPEVRLDTMLRNLFNGGQLSVSGWGADRIWSLGPDARFATPGKPRKREKPPVVITPPRQFNVFGSTYQPAPAPALRAGAQDFLRFSSRGYRC